MKCVMTVDIRRPFSEVNECMMDGDVGEYVHSSVAVPLFDAVATSYSASTPDYPQTTPCPR